MSHLPADFCTIGVSSDLSLQHQIDEELSEFFSSPSISTAPSAACTCVSSDCVELETDSDIDFDDAEVGNHDVLRSPVIQSRLRDFIHQDSVNFDSDENESESDNRCQNVNTDMIDSVQVRTSRNICQCLRQFRTDDIVENRINVSAMDKEARDVFIMGQLQACGTSKGEVTKGGKDRKRHRFDYQFLNSPVCKECFLFVNNIGDRFLKNIRKHLYKERAVSRVHGNTSRTPKHAVTYDEAQQVVKFITRFADQFGLPQPAAPRGRDDIPPIYLPGKENFKSVHQKYVEACGDETRALSEICINEANVKVL